MSPELCGNTSLSTCFIMNDDDGELRYCVKMVNTPYTTEYSSLMEISLRSNDGEEGDFAGSGEVAKLDVRLGFDD